LLALGTLLALIQPRMGRAETPNVDGTTKGEGSMNLQRRNLVLLVTLATAAATPALAQTTAIAITPTDTGTPSGASIPDFSGSWSHASLNGLELPQSGPGPVRNTSRLRTGPQAGVGNIRRLVGDHTHHLGG
jgi:hypothetical protein